MRSVFIFLAEWKTQMCIVAIGFLAQSCQCEGLWSFLAALLHGCRTAALAPVISSYFCDERSTNLHMPAESGPLLPFCVSGWKHPIQWLLLIILSSVTVSQVHLQIQWEPGDVSAVIERTAAPNTLKLIRRKGRIYPASNKQSLPIRVQTHFLVNALVATEISEMRRSPSPPIVVVSDLRDNGEYLHSFSFRQRALSPRGRSLLIS